MVAFNKYRIKQRLKPSRSLNKRQALKMVEASYLAAATALIWIALYYLPIGGAIFRLSVPLPLALLQLRRGFKSGLEGVILCTFLLTALMGPLRGPLFLFPYGLLSLWLGLSWYKKLSWWFSWGIGALIGTLGFLVRVIVLSFLVGENLWVIITRAAASLLEKSIDFLGLPFSPGISEVQVVAICLVIVQEVVYVLCLHALAFWIFPRLRASMPEPPDPLKAFISLDPL